MPAPASAFQSTSDTTWVISPSSVLIDVLSLVCLMVAVQPGWGSTRTPAIGWSVGRCTCRPTVLAESLSSGTRKVIAASLVPAVTPGAVTVTCAAAEAAVHSPRVVIAAVTAPMRVGVRDVWSSVSLAAGGVQVDAVVLSSR